MTHLKVFQSITEHHVHHNVIQVMFLSVAWTAIEMSSFNASWSCPKTPQQENIVELYQLLQVIWGIGTPARSHHAADCTWSDSLHARLFRSNEPL